jgi:hypothetical protein
MRCFRTFAIAATTSASLISAAAAEDFTFNVRVEVSNLASDVERLVIECAACNEPCHSTGAVVIGTRDWFIGSGSATHNFAPGAARNFNGVIRVAFNAAAGQVPERARYYRCEMRVPGPIGGSPAVYGAKPGTPHVTRLEGSIGPTFTPAPLTPDPKGTIPKGLPKGAPTLPK